MSYKTVKDGIIGILNSLGYDESAEAVDFKNAAALTYQSTFILKCLSGEIAEQIQNYFYDDQEWQVQIAFERNSQNDLVSRDRMQAAKDAVLVALDDPDSWESFVHFMKYVKWSMVEAPNYYVLDIRLQVKDRYTYS